MMSYFKTFLILSVCVVGLNAHGRLMDPPSRNAMWRFGFPNPVNYDDNEVYCGGYGVQFGQNNGKCGVCGDPYDQEEPREHESNGLYGNGIIGRRYAVGQRVTVEIELTTNHQGHMTLKLCPINDNNKVTTDECFDKYPLYLVDDNSTATYVIPEETPKVAVLKYDVQLPPGLICQQCVIQWTYFTGNTWGKCENGTEDMGCGPQETFRNCADITIYSSTGAFPPDADTSINTIEEFPYAIYYQDSSERRHPLVVRSQVCVPTPNFEEEADSYDWCKVNCLKYPPNCPENKCKCIVGCRAIGKLAGIEGTDVYCLRNCFHNGAKNCPKDECECYGADEENEQLESTRSQQNQTEVDDFETTTFNNNVF